MKHIKRIAAAVLALCALLALTACGGLQEKVESKLWETAAPILVQGNMDLLYKGVCDENYLKLVNSTQEDCLPYYEENMALQAQAIMAAFEINDVNNNQADRFIDIMKQVYAKADYTIGAASPGGRQPLPGGRHRDAPELPRPGIRQPGHRSDDLLQHLWRADR